MNDILKDMDTRTWSKATEENKEAYLEKYGEVFVYKDKIVPPILITKEIREWYQQ